MDRPNLAVLSHALVTRLTFVGNRATGVEVVHDGKMHSVAATSEIVVSLGAINTPKLLMQSGIGNETELQRFGIPIVQHLPGVGQNLQDHAGFDCVWEPHEALSARNNFAEATYFWKSDSKLNAPDLQVCHGEFTKATPENIARFQPPANGWILFGGLQRPKSKGQIVLTGPKASDPVQIETNFLSHPDDMRAAIACVELCREVGNSAALTRFAKREIMPGNLQGADLENYIRDAASTYWHQTCTAKVYGIDNLRIADGSIMPRVTIGNTMAPCVIIGERAAEIIKTGHKL
jgi:choline dehydrogenase